jgi:predicted RNase H-like nuclease (RuvC/YqgF family)
MHILDNEDSTSIKNMTQQLENITAKLNNLYKSNEYLQEEMQTMATILPKLTTNINQQQALISNSIDESREYRAYNLNCIRAIQLQQSEQNDKITQLKQILHSMVRPSTTTSLNRIREKQQPIKNTNNHSFNVQNNNEIELHLPTTQIDLLLNDDLTS